MTSIDDGFKRLNIYDVQIQEDGRVKVSTDLSPDDMKILLTLGLLACMQQGVMLISVAEKMGLVVEEEVEANDTEEPVEITQPNRDWEAILDGPKSVTKEDK